MATSDADLQVVLDHLKQWKFSNLNKPATLVPKLEFGGPAGRNYYLKNAVARKFLQHEEQTFGINLGWTDDAEPETARKVTRWFLPRNGTSVSPIRYGERLALGLGKQPSYIRHERRSVGIDLDWSSSPVFEWRILGGEPGHPVDPTKYSALYNDDIKECLIFFDRTAGGDIGWPSSQTWRDQAEDALGRAFERRLQKAYDDLLGGS